jgi:GGDEF domain-containing protein
MLRKIGTISICEVISHAADFISEDVFKKAEQMTFAHDGLRDSLTHLAAPPYFYENLRRELITADRNKSRLTLIRFQLFAEPDSVDSSAEKSSQDSQSRSRESLYEVAILSFAEFLKSVTRAEDLCARLGQLEFTLILKGAREIGDHLSQRVLTGWKMDSFSCKASLVSAQRGEGSLEILNRLDNQELQGAPQR